MNLEQEFKNLRVAVDQLLKFKAEKERQQLKFPLDIDSIKIVQKGTVVGNGSSVDASGLLTATTAIEVTVGENGTKLWLLASPTP